MDIYNTDPGDDEYGTPLEPSIINAEEDNDEEVDEGKALPVYPTPDEGKALPVYPELQLLSLFPKVRLINTVGGIINWTARFFQTPVARRMTNVTGQGDDLLNAANEVRTAITKTGGEPLNIERVISNIQNLDTQTFNSIYRFSQQKGVSISRLLNDIKEGKDIWDLNTEVNTQPEAPEVTMQSELDITSQIPMFRAIKDLPRWRRIVRMSKGLGLEFNEAGQPIVDASIIDNLTDPMIQNILRRVNLIGNKTAVTGERVRRFVWDMIVTDPVSHQTFRDFKLGEQHKTFIDLTTKNTESFDFLRKDLLNRGVDPSSIKSAFQVVAHHQFPVLAQKTYFIFNGLAVGSEDYYRVMNAFLELGVQPGVTINPATGQGNLLSTIGGSGAIGGTGLYSPHGIAHVYQQRAFELNNITNRLAAMNRNTTIAERMSLVQEMGEISQKSYRVAQDAIEVFQTLSTNYPDSNIHNLVELFEYRISNTGQFKTDIGDFDMLGLAQMVESIANEVGVPTTGLKRLNIDTENKLIQYLKSEEFNTIMRIIRQEGTDLTFSPGQFYE